MTWSSQGGPLSYFLVRGLLYIPLLCQMHRRNNLSDRLSNNSAQVSACTVTLTHLKQTPIALICGVGANFVLLPLSAHPDLNPMEMMWSKIIKFLLKAAARNHEELLTARGKSTVHRHHVR